MPQAKNSAERKFNFIEAGSFSCGGFFVYAETAINALEIENQKE